MSHPYAGDVFAPVSPVVFSHPAAEEARRTPSDIDRRRSREIRFFTAAATDSAVRHP
ncbi:hypothetical protein V5P93_004174 [Actinokineospora auranticolor]|uniref:Uncharacterized protein n=1 Tax=Actinokineospora auranticolor TaxID=155976 RepID=A0A2S6GIS0_9PSEU|nr:hypothetical protein [Actinokineospora auranticolor]PPK65083.1 hypothetical protein CLV40_116126 [Actinokineospora auranticolor]